MLYGKSMRDSENPEIIDRPFTERFFKSLDVLSNTPEKRTFHFCSGPTGSPVGGGGN